MMIRPASAIRKNYKSIADYCKEEGKPVFLTHKGEGELVVMSIAQYERREMLYDLRDKLLASEARYLNGEKCFTPEELRTHLRERKDGTNA